MTYHWLWMVPCLWSSKGKWELLACAKTAVLLPLKCTLAVKGLDIIIQPPPFTSEGLPYLMHFTLLIVGAIYLVDGLIEKPPMT